MKKNCLQSPFVPLLLFAFGFFISCQASHSELPGVERTAVKDSVTQMAVRISQDISNQGPAAWMNYFEDSPDFFMASGGEIAFKDYATAKAFVLNTLVKNIPHIKLAWEDLRVDPLTSGLASIGADFSEELTDASGKTQNVSGYFTGTAHLTAGGWKLINLHWSIKPPAK